MPIGSPPRPCNACAAHCRAAHVTIAGPSGVLPSWTGSRLARMRWSRGRRRAASTNFMACSQHPTGRSLR
eukprot:11169971-Lingulodinium_polyedra.AAC.1